MSILFLLSDKLDQLVGFWFFVSTAICFCFSKPNNYNFPLMLENLKLLVLHNLISQLLKRIIYCYSWHLQKVFNPPVLNQTFKILCLKDLETSITLLPIGWWLINVKFCVSRFGHIYISINWLCFPFYFIVYHT